MKKTNFWSLMALCFCLFGALTFTACGDDDDDNKDNIGNSPIVGTWQEINEVEGDGFWHKTIDTWSFERTGRFFNRTAMYNDPENMNVAHEDMTYSGTFTVNGNTVNLNYTGCRMIFDGQENEQASKQFEPYKEQYTFTVANGKLKLRMTVDGRVVEYGPFEMSE